MKLFTILLGLALPLALLSSVANGQTKELLVPSITVVGEGSVTAKPDMAQINLGVTSYATSASDALKQNSEAMQNLFEILKAKGIADKDIQTTSFNVSPEYKRDPQGRMKPTIIGYRVTNQVQVKVRQIPILGSLLDEVVQEGTNQINGISFSVSEPAHLLDEARKKAMDHAIHKAELYTNRVGAKVGRALLIQEQTPQLPQPRFYGMKAAQGGGGAVPIAEGEQEFQVNITVTFALE